MRWRFPDKALAFSPWESLLTLKAGSLEEYGLREVWGEAGRSPGTLLLESCLQSARWLIEASSSFTLSGEPQEIGFWQALPGLAPGERFCAFLRVVEREAGCVRLVLRQKILLPGEPPPTPQEVTQNRERIDGDFTFALISLSDRCLPDDRACLWREIAP